MITGLAAFISAITGLLGGSVPRIFDMFEKRMTFQQELQIRQAELTMRKAETESQLALAKAQIDGKIQETYYQAAAEQFKADAQAFLEVQATMSRPTGIGWIDKLNASMRPLMFFATMVLFACIVVQVAVTTPEAMAAQAATQFWMMVEGVVGYFVGARTVIKRPEQ